MNSAAILTTPPRIHRQKDFVKDFGTVQAKIGTTHAHRLGIPMELKDGTVIKAGTIVHLGIEDLSRHAEVDGHIKWVCRSPHCIGKHWPTKKALLNEHPDNRTLAKQEETHLFFGVVEIPAVEGKPEQRNDKGVVTQKAIDAQPPVVLLVSDEE
jgi:hypothetical protein